MQMSCPSTPDEWFSFWLDLPLAFAGGMLPSDDSGNPVGRGIADVAAGQGTGERRMSTEVEGTESGGGDLPPDSLEDLHEGCFA